MSRSFRAEVFRLVLSAAWIALVAWSVRIVALDPVTKAPAPAAAEARP